MCQDPKCKDPKQCASHECTLGEIEKLREENKKIREDLDELKGIIHGLHDIESVIREIYSSHRHPIIHSIKKFFEGGKKDGV